MLMQSWVTVRSPPNVSGDSHQKNTTAFSSTVEVDGDLKHIEKKNKTKKQKKAERNTENTACTASFNFPSARRTEIDLKSCNQTVIVRSGSCTQVRQGDSQGFQLSSYSKDINLYKSCK